MTFTWPWMLIALAPVALMALWTLWRPMRQTTVVPAVSLWLAALAGLAGKGQRRNRRLSIAWVCLLCGAAAAAVALARPQLRSAQLRRHVAVAVYPSAELAGDGGAALRESAGMLLDRLGAGDRVQVVLPDVLGGPTDWLTPDDARRLIGDLTMLPARADALSVDVPPSGQVPTVVLAPAGSALARGDNVSVIELPTSLPAVTIDRVAATPLPDGGVQVFVAARNHTGQPVDVTVRAETLARGLTRLAGGEENLTIPPGEAAGGTQTLSQAGEIITVALFVAGQGQPADVAYLVRQPKFARKVAMVGEDNPLVRRYIAADELLELVADAADGDIVIANGTPPPAGKPALVFAASTIAPFRGDVDLLEHVELSGADIAADHPVMAGVDLAGVAVRRLPVWQGADNSIWAKVLASVDGGAFIVVDEANRPGGLLGRRVIVLCDVGMENTNWLTLESFIFFMANTMRWLSPVEEGEGEYVYRAPMEVGSPADWRQVLADEGLAEQRGLGEAGVLLGPGVYAGPEGRLHAVSLVALRSGRPGVTVARAAAAAELDEAVGEGEELAAWPMLVGLAGVLWLAGWTLRVVR